LKTVQRRHGESTPDDASPDAPAAFVARKQREIALLDGCLSHSLALPPVGTLAHVLEQKLKIAAALRAERSLESWAITETARPEVQTWQTGAYRFTYGYQRADLNVQGPPIYAALAEKTRVLTEETLYTTSGMSAIAAFVTGLLAVRGRVEWRMPRDGYGETRELLERFPGRIRIVASPRGRAATPDTTRVLMVDSAAQSGVFARLAQSSRDVALLVVDTTCYDQASGRIRRIVRWAQRRNVPVVMLRSHAKLDCLGIEFGRMGSIVLAWHRDDTAAWMHDLVAEVRNAIRLIGAAPIPAHFPPFVGTDEYRACTAARTASMMRNVRRMQRTLRATPLGAALTPYQHGLYFTLSPRGTLRIRDTRRAVNALAEALAAEGLPVRHAGSFGFDFVAVEWFPDPVTHRNVIRVAPGDIPPSVALRVADGLVRWFARQGHGEAEPPADDQELAAP